MKRPKVVDDATFANRVEWRDAEHRLAIMESFPHGVRMILRRDEQERDEEWALVVEQSQEEPS